MKREQKRGCMIQEEEGAIIVEATISLPVFMFTIITFLSIVNICVAQAKMGVFVNETAKELSKYSYLCVVTGLSQKHGDVAGKGADGREAVYTVLSQDNGIDMIMSAAEFGANVAEDADLRQSLLYFLGSEAINGVESAMAEKIVEKMWDTRFTNGAASGRAYANFLRIGDVDYSGTKFMPDGTSDIQIVVSYDVHVIKLLGIDVKFHFTQCAKTKAWGKP